MKYVPATGIVDRFILCFNQMTIQWPQNNAIVHTQQHKKYFTLFNNNTLNTALHSYKWSTKAAQ